MTAFEVSINGRRVCVTGAGDDCMLSAHVDYYPTSSRDIKTFFSVSALNQPTSDRLQWSMPDIGVGSEVAIRLVDVEATDPPDVRRPHDPVRSLEQDKMICRHSFKSLPTDDARAMLAELTALLAAKEVTSSSDTSH